jgi:Tfp pilus assembly protein PilV
MMIVINVFVFSLSIEKMKNNDRQRERERERERESCSCVDKASYGRSDHVNQPVTNASNQHIHSGDIFSNDVQKNLSTIDTAS